MSSGPEDKIPPERPSSESPGEPTTDAGTAGANGGSAAPGTGDDGYYTAASGGSGAGAPGSPGAGPTAATGAAGGDDGAGSGEADTEGLEEVLDPLRAMTIERDEYLDTLRRVQAEFENYKKRMVRQQTEQLERAAEALVTKLLPVLDTLALAVSHTDTDATEEGKALAQVSNSIWDVLTKEGLEKVEPLDAEFDPNESEAVMHEPAEEGQDGSKVVEVFRPGYRWRGRVLRAAMVKVRG